MIRLLSLLFCGDWHRHEWGEPFNSARVFDSEYDKLPIANKYHCRCKTCGKIRAFRV